MDVFLQVESQFLVVGLIGDRLEGIKRFPLDDDLYDIYIGRVENYLPAAEAYFVSLGPEKKGFLTRPRRKNLKAGDEILCQVLRKNPPPKRDRVIDNIFLTYENYLFYPLKKRYKRDDSWVSERQVPKRIQEIFLEDYKLLLRESKFLPIPRRLTQSRQGLINFLTGNYEKITTNSKEIYQSLGHLIPGDWQVDPDYDYRYDQRISRDLLSLEQKRISLESGGEIVIDKTESLTAIDVNTRYAIRPEERLKTAFEAVDETIYQMEGRQVQGIILIDMFQLKEEEQALLEKYIQQAVQGTSLNYFGPSKLNLLEFTRSTSKN